MFIVLIIGLSIQTSTRVLTLKCVLRHVNYNESGTNSKIYSERKIPGHILHTITSVRDIFLMYDKYIQITPNKMTKYVTT